VGGVEGTQLLMQKEADEFRGDGRRSWRGRLYSDIRAKLRDLCSEVLHRGEDCGMCHTSR
jgi:hypothetical protein